MVVHVVESLGECGTDTARGLTGCHSQAVFEVSGFATSQQ